MMRELSARAQTMMPSPHAFAQAAASNAARPALVTSKWAASDRVFNTSGSQLAPSNAACQRRTKSTSLGRS